jgi:hypothetical protein
VSRSFNPKTLNALALVVSQRRDEARRKILVEK